MKVFIILAVSIVGMAGSTFGSQKTTGGSKRAVDKRSLWQLGSYFSGFGDSLARSDDAHGHGGEQQFGGGGSGGGWHQDYVPQVQQHQYQWSQLHSVEGHDAPSAHPVHEWHAGEQESHAGQTQQHHFDDHQGAPLQHHFEGSFEQPKQEQPAFDWHHQQLRVDDSKGWQEHGAGASHEWQHDEGKDDGAGHGDWAPIAGSSDVHKEHSVKSVSSATEEHQHQEWAPAEGKEKHEEHHHTKIIKVPYPVHIEKPFPVYIEKPFIVEKSVPLKLYIKKKYHH